MRRLSVSLGLLVLAAAPAAVAIPEPGGLSAVLRASAEEEAAFRLTADGVLVYQCQAMAVDPSSYTWLFVAPDATLYEDTRSIGILQTPNLWESLSDRSSVSGTARTTQPAGAGNLPWVLYRAQPLAASGMFAGVTSIQRVNTSGGTAPPGGCGEDSEGEEARVPFTADFYFYKRRGTG